MLETAKWSNYASGEYAKGRACGSIDICSAKYRDVSRWFCPSCDTDFCERSEAKALEPLEIMNGIAVAKSAAHSQQPVRRTEVQARAIFAPSASSAAIAEDCCANPSLPRDGSGKPPLHGKNCQNRLAQDAFVKQRVEAITAALATPSDEHPPTFAKFPRK